MDALIVYAADADRKGNQPSLVIMSYLSASTEHCQGLGLGPRPNFMALLTAEFCAYDHHSMLTCKRKISALAV